MGCYLFEAKTNLNRGVRGPSGQWSTSGMESHTPHTHTYVKHTHSYTHIHMVTHPHAHTHILSHTYVHTLILTCSLLHTHYHTFIHSHTLDPDSLTRSHTDSYILKLKHTHSLSHTQKHTHIHSHVQTHRYLHTHSYTNTLSHIHHPTPATLPIPPSLLGPSVTSLPSLGAWEQKQERGGVEERWQWCERADSDNGIPPLPDTPTLRHRFTSEPWAQSLLLWTQWVEGPELPR